MSYPLQNNPANPDATPLYNDSIFKFWNWFDEVWSCTDWVIWHKSMVGKYGISYANSKFMSHWNNLATASGAIDCRSFNTSFRDYMKRVGLLDSLYSGIGIIAQPIGTASDVTTNIAGGITGASKTFKVLVPLVIIVIAIMGVLYVTKGLKHATKK